MKGKRKLVIGILAVLLVLVIGSIALRSGKPEETLVDTTAGVSVIRNLENRDVDEVIHKIRESSGDLLREQYAERISLIQQDENQAWGMFDDFLFVGDSRCVAFVTYGFFNEENVIAHPLVNIMSHLEPNIDNIVAKNPGHLYLIYGFNDIECGRWHYGEEFANSYGELVDTIHARLPETKIYIIATMPVIMGRTYTSNYDGYTLIPDWNQNVAEMCSSREYVYYLDTAYLYDQYQNLYTDDGVHFFKEFYPHWAAAILTCQYQYELEEELQAQAQMQEHAQMQEQEQTQEQAQMQAQNALQE